MIQLKLTTLDLRGVAWTQRVSQVGISLLLLQRIESMHGYGSLLNLNVDIYVYWK